MLYLVFLVLLDAYHFRRNDRPSPLLYKTVCEVTCLPYGVSETARRIAIRMTAAAFVACIQY